MGIHKGASSYNSVVASCAHLNLYLLPFSTKAVFTPPGYAIKVSLRLVSTLAPTICEHTTPTLPSYVFSPRPASCFTPRVCRAFSDGAALSCPLLPAALAVRRFIHSFIFRDMTRQSFYGTRFASAPLTGNTSCCCSWRFCFFFGSVVCGLQCSYVIDVIRLRKACVICLMGFLFDSTSRDCR